jgi:hypothetical protein
MEISLLKEKAQCAASVTRSPMIGRYWYTMKLHKIPPNGEGYWVLLNVSRMAPFLEPTQLASESLLR